MIKIIDERQRIKKRKNDENNEMDVEFENIQNIKKR